MPPKGKPEPPVEIPPLPTAMWKAPECEVLPLDLANPKVIQFTNKPNGKFPGDYLSLCALLRVPPHPCIPKTGTLPIEHQDAGIDCLDLRNVVFDSRTVQLLSMSLRSAKAIVSLNFFNAGLSPASLKTLAESLPATSVVHFRCDYNPLEEHDESTQAFLRSLTAPTSKLVTLSLRGNALRDSAISTLCEHLPGNTCLQALNLFDNKVSDVGGAKLAEAIKLSTKPILGSLSLANNRLTRAGAHAWSDVFSSGRGQGLQVLNLSSNRIDFEGIQSLLMTLASQKGHLPLLKSVALHRNSIKGAPESFWAPLLKEVEPIRCTL